MRILLTNDDGVDATGLTVLSQALRRDHDVVVVAPEKERSGSSHGITLRETVWLTPLGSDRYSCSGTPADCVYYSLIGAIEGTIDLVISGINHGPNLGTDIVFSGTAAAARQAGLMNIPGIAVSGVPAADDYDFSGAAEYMRRNLTGLLRCLDPRCFLNINIPDKVSENSISRLTRPVKRRYQDRLAVHTRKDHSVGYKLDGFPVLSENMEDSDWEAVSANMVSISPVTNEPAGLEVRAEKTWHEWIAALN